MPPISSTDLVGALAGVPLLSERQMRELRETIAAEFPDPSRLAAELRRRGWLTTYQLDRLLRGAGKELILGAYHLLEPIGAGGMGRVFKARHTIMDRIVAIKVIHPGRLGQPEALRRFRQEIVAAAKLNHPNVIATNDAQEVDGQVFLVMEFCDGTDLSKVVAESGPLPVRTACDYMRQAALGLEHIREHRLVHRDIKPQNLLLAGSTIKILDLGLARLRTGEQSGSYASLTGEGIVLGTPDYLAPEQAEDARQADIRSDIYSLGSTLYFLLADQVPFPGGALFEKVLRLRIEEPTPLRRLRPDVPAPVLAIVQKMMAKSPGDRFQTPREVAEALASWLDLKAATQRDAVLPDTSTFETVVSAPRSEPSIRSLALRFGRRAALIALAGIGVGATAWTIIVRNWPADAQPKSDDPKGNGGIHPAPAAVPGRWRAGATYRYRSDVVKPNAADGLWAVAMSPDGHSAAVGFGDLNRPNQSPGIVRVLNFQSGKWQDVGQFEKCAVSHVAFANNGHTVIAASGILSRSVEVSGVGEIMIRDLNGGKARIVALGIEGILGLAVDPRGRWAIVTGRQGQLRRIDLALDKVLPETLENKFKMTISALAVSSDGSLVAMGYHNGLLEVRKLAELTQVPIEIRVPKDDMSRISGLAFRNNDMELVGTTWHVDGADSQIKVWDLDRKQPISVIPESGSDIYSMALAADGRTLATGTQDGVVRIWDLNERRVLLKENGHNEPVYGLSFAKDGRTLASCSTDGIVRLWVLD